MVDHSTLVWTRASLFLISMTALGRAIQIYEGVLGPPPYYTIAWLSFAILALASAVFLPAAPRMGRPHFQAVVAICLFTNFAQLVTGTPCQDLAATVQPALFEIGVVAQALLCGMVLMSEGRARQLAFTGLLLSTAFLGNWAIISCPKPRMDVYEFQTEAAATFARGHNPYGMTFPNVFAPDTSLYGPGLVRDGRVQFGYPYFPETLLAVMPASLAQLDIRYTEVIAILLSAILIVLISPGPPGYSAAMLFLTTPRLCFVIEKSWTEPIVVLTLCATVASAIKWPRLLPFALGLFLASKQYVPAAAVFFFVGSRPLRESIVLLAKATIVALAVTLPVALWNIPAFWHSVVELQFRQPFRADAISYLSWMGEAFWVKSAILLIPFAAFLATTLLVLWRRRSVGFAAVCALCFLVFFSLNKQAFANYYFFVIGAMACAVAELAGTGAALDCSAHRL
jgi:hypothetical protein